jgi:glutamate carboxypeptidase
MASESTTSTLAQARGVAAAVRDRARSDLDLLLADLADWVSVDSPSGDVAAVDSLSAEIGARLTRYGATPEVVPSPEGRYLHASVSGSGRSRVALLCHHDTVFSAGTTALRPFSADSDVARGPGVADMKGGLVVAAHALRILRDQRPAAIGRLELVSVPDEEQRTTPFRTIDRLEGFDAVLCMECGRPGDGIVTSRKGGSWLTITASGVAAHAGVAASRGRSALLAACREALRLAELDGARDGLGVHVTTLSAGEVLNSVASQATMMVDLRAWHAEDLDWGLEQAGRFGAHDGVELSLEASTRVPPLERTASVAALAGAAAAIGRALGRPLFEVATGGVSDACWTAAAGLPTLDGLGPIGEDDHSPDERIAVPSLADRCGLVAGLIAAVEDGVLDSRSEAAERRLPSTDLGPGR